MTAGGPAPRTVRVGAESCWLNSARPSAFLSLSSLCLRRPHELPARQHLVSQVNRQPKGQLWGYCPTGRDRKSTTSFSGPAGVLTALIHPVPHLSHQHRLLWGSDRAIPTSALLGCFLVASPALPGVTPPPCSRCDPPASSQGGPQCCQHKPASPPAGCWVSSGRALALPPSPPW